MSRYIDADKLLELYDYQELNEMINAYARKGVDKEKWNVPIGVVKQNIKDMPTADVRENVRGHWELKTDGFGGLSDNVTAWANYCSVCGYHYGTPYNFCPNCGAEMENSIAMNKKTKAEWICLGHKMGFCKHPYSVDYKCSNCGYEEYTLLSSPPDKCPNCGAEMQGEGR